MGVSTLEGLIKLLDENLTLQSSEIIEDTIYLHVTSTLSEVKCPFCGTKSSRVHSYYERRFQDLPIQNMKTIIVLNNRKMFCDNPNCSHRTFAESFTFIKPKSKKTNRLIDEIISLSKSMSSVAAEKYLRKNVVKVGKSTICELLKKGQK